MSGVDDRGDVDSLLLARVARGDERAVQQLVDRHLDRTHALARRMLGDAFEAEDVTQDAFMRVWRHAASWRPGEARFQTWLHRVTLNLCYDRLRKRREALFAEPPEIADDAPSALQQVASGDVQRRVEQAVAELPERQRAAIVLCHYQELSNREAADVLDVSVDALESLLARGRRALKAALIGEAGELLTVFEGTNR